MRVLVDTNVVLDVLLDRRPFADAATGIFASVEESRIEGFLCATTVTTIDYLLTQSLVRATAREALQKLLGLFEIAPVNRSVLVRSLHSKISDFEDAVLEQSGLLVGVDAVVTRNTKDFRGSSVTVLDPTELLTTLQKMDVAKKGDGNDTP